MDAGIGLHTLNNYSSFIKQKILCFQTGSLMEFCCLIIESFGPGLPDRLPGHVLCSCVQELHIINAPGSTFSSCHKSLWLYFWEAADDWRLHSFHSNLIKVIYSPGEHAEREILRGITFVRLGPPLSFFSLTPSPCCPLAELHGGPPRRCAVRQVQLAAESQVATARANLWAHPLRLHPRLNHLDSHRALRVCGHRSQLELTGLTSLPLFYV